MSKTMVKTTPKAETETVETVAETKVVEKKVYNDEDLIDCISIVSGGLYIEGDRSRALYTWADYGDTVGVEYRDLVFMIRQNSKNIFEPRIVINDDEIVSQYKNLQKIYDDMYSVGDFRDILNLSADAMINQINSLPNGAKNAFKDYASNAIFDGSLDSVSKIRAIDEIFATNYLLTLAEN